MVLEKMNKHFLSKVSNKVIQARAIRFTTLSLRARSYLYRNGIDQALGWRKLLFVRKRVIFCIAFMCYFVCCLPSPLFDDPYAYIVNDNQGELLGARIASDGQWRFPVIDSVPQKFEKCIIAFEDKRFYYHPGIDPIALSKAIVDNVQAQKVVRGGSTLTMQLMRISRKGKPRSFFNKAIELIMALRMELSSSKKTILQLYASHAPFGGNVVGLEAASWRYFAKRPDHLSWAETATLAVLPNAPSLIHFGKNRDALLKKRNKLLSQLYKNEVIDQLTYELSLNEELPPKPLPLPNITPHLVETSAKKNISVHRVNSTIDLSIQSMAQDVAQTYYQMYNQEHIHNLAILILDTQTGHALAYVGNTEGSDNENQVDMIMARRSSGSLLKPLIYALNIDEGIWMPKQLVYDTPLYIDGFAPENFDKAYRGAVHVDDALAMSLNVPFVSGLQSYGVSKFLTSLKKMHVTTLNKGADHYGLSLILGGGEVNLWEMCGVYASMGRTLQTYTTTQSKYDDFNFYSPSFTGIQKRKSQLTFEAPIVSAASVYHTFEALSKLQRPNEEGMWQVFSSSSQIAWKTGTSYGHKDAWAIGVTPNYTIGVWVGNSDGEGRAGLVGGTKAAPILFDIVNRLPLKQWFRSPLDDMIPVAVCNSSGHIASSICPEVDSTLVCDSKMDRIVCPHHITIFTDQDEQFQVVRECCQCEPKAVSWFQLPAMAANYYRNLNPMYKDLPLPSSDCESMLSQDVHSFTKIDIIYPPNNAKVYIGKNLKGLEEKVVLEAGSNRVQTELHWHLDNHYLGSTKGFHTMAVFPKKGEHIVAIIDNEGNKVTRKFEVVN